jgi:hypothetical protein
MTKILLSIVMCWALIMPGCNGGPLSRLTDQMDYAPLFFQGLVIAKVITPEQAQRFGRGANRIEVIATDTKSCLAEDVKEDIVCYNDMRSQVTSALNEFFPQTNTGAVGQWVTLIGQIADLIVAKNTPVVGAGAPNVDYNQKLDAKIDELERLMKSNSPK